MHMSEPFGCVHSLSRVQLFATPWTVAHQAPLCMGFSRQEHWSGLPFPSAGDLPDLGFEPRSRTLQADTLPSEPPGKSSFKVRETKTNISQALVCFRGLTSTIKVLKYHTNKSVSFFFKKKPLYLLKHHWHSTSHVQSHQIIKFSLSVLNS